MMDRRFSNPSAPFLLDSISVEQRFQKNHNLHRESAIG
jgi:hypothetical protein